MDRGVDRRQVLKLGAGAAAAVAAVGAIPTVKAHAATRAATPAATPKKLPIGTMSIDRLWGHYTKTTYVYEVVNGKRKRKAIKTTVYRTRNVWSGTDKTTLNKGGMCHWIGTATPLSNGNCLMFGHRTSAGGLMRNVHKIKLNDKVVLTITGVGTKTYNVVVPKTIIGKKDFAQAINYGNTTKSYLTLVACTKQTGLPTSLNFRFLVRCVEV